MGEHRKGCLLRLGVTRVTCFIRHAWRWLKRASLRHSPEVRRLLAQRANLRVAQIGGVTSTPFDTFPHCVRFNTHDWRSGEDGRDGGQYIKLEGLVLPVTDSSFDVVVSRHVLEHIGDPIAALLEWSRVLRRGGYLYLSLPDRPKTPETARALTPLAHLVRDHVAQVPPLDPGHKAEIETTGVGIIEHDRYELPYVHFHTFEKDSAEALLRHCGFEIVPLTLSDWELFHRQPWDLILLARKP